MHVNTGALNVSPDQCLQGWPLQSNSARFDSPSNSDYLSEYPASERDVRHLKDEFISDWRLFYPWMGGEEFSSNPQLVIPEEFSRGYAGTMNRAGRASHEHDFMPNYLLFGVSFIIFPRQCQLNEKSRRPWKSMALFGLYLFRVPRIFVPEVNED